MFCCTKPRIMSVFVLAAAAMVGCGHQAVPMQVRFADVHKGALKDYDGSRPLIIEFQPGERLPLDLQLSGEGFELDPQHPPLEILVKQHCFLRVGSDGFRMSLDGENFDAKPRKPGTFQIGIGAKKGEPAKVTVILEGPRH